MSTLLLSTHCQNDWRLFTRTSQHCYEKVTVFHTGILELALIFSSNCRAQASILQENQGCQEHVTPGIACSILVSFKSAFYFWTKVKLSGFCESLNFFQWSTDFTFQFILLRDGHYKGKVMVLSVWIKWSIQFHLR